jgi:hypothetical protein
VNLPRGKQPERGMSGRRVHALRWPIAVSMALVVLCGTIPAPVGAAGLTLKIEMAKAATIGAEIPVTVRAIDPTGRPAPEARVGLYVDDNYYRNARTTAKGIATFTLRDAATAQAGLRRITARVDVDLRFGPARTTNLLTLRPAAIEILAVPAIAGLPITLGGREKVTDEAGRAVFTVQRTGKLRLSPNVERIEQPDVRVSFVRWGDNHFRAERELDVRGDVTLQLGIRIAYRGSVRFVDLSGRAVDPKNITVARFVSSMSGETARTEFGQMWWEASTAVKRTAGLQVSPTLWRLKEVGMRGTNVVHSGQQFWEPKPGATWTIQVLLFALEVKTEDALTGAPVKGRLELTYPDGTRRYAEPGDNGAMFVDLPRGNYNVKFFSDGTAPPEPVALSRSQTISLRVITFFDIAVAATVLIVAMSLLLWFGRGHQLRALGSSAVRVAAAGAHGTVRRAAAGVAFVGAGLATVRSDLRAVIHPARPATIEEPYPLALAREKRLSPRSAALVGATGPPCGRCGHSGTAGAWYCLACGNALRAEPVAS